MEEYYKKKDRDKHNERMTKYRLDDKDDIILRHLVEYPSTKVKDLAQIVNLGPEAISLRIKKPAFQRALADIRADCWDLARRAQMSALRRLDKIIKTGKDRDAIEASKIVLNPILNASHQEPPKNVKEVIYATRFGEQGQLISETKQIEDSTPKDTFELLEGSGKLKNAKNAKEK